MKLVSLKAIGTVAALTLATNLLGFGREVLVARAYGANETADAFVTAYAIVAACFLVFSAATVQSTFMPRYQARQAEDPRHATWLFQNSFVYLFLITAAITAALMYFAEPVASLVVPGFSPGKLALTAQLLVWLAPMIVFIATGALLQSVSHATNRFLAPALVPFLSNLVIIACLLALVPQIGVAGLAVGYLLGAILWWGLSVVVRQEIFSVPFKRLDRQEMVGLLLVTLPLIWLLVADQMSAIFQKTVVSDLETGSIATLNYAARLSGLPLGVFAAAIATVFFPLLTRAHAGRNAASIHAIYRDGLAATILVMLPMSLMFMAGADVIVQTVFERGAFDSSASERTAYALVYYAAGMVPQALIVYLNRVFFAAQNTRTPMTIGLFSVAIHLVANLLFVEQIGYVGIALGTTVYAVVYSVLLLANLHRARLENARSAVMSLWRIALSAGFSYSWLWLFDPGALGSFLILCTASSVIYLIILVILREPLTKHVVKW